MSDLHLRTLPSGLIVAEEFGRAAVVGQTAFPSPPPAEKKSPIRCRACGVNAHPDLQVIVFFSQDGWHKDSPICGHPPYYTCPVCYAVPHAEKDWSKHNCPECGCDGVYT